MARLGTGSGRRGHCPDCVTVRFRYRPTG
jgi:hypothetical protein